jgi:DNA-binding winged helix-turn-helix (wHTH) protein
MSSPLRVKKRSKEDFVGNLLNWINLEDQVYCGRRPTNAVAQGQSMLDLVPFEANVVAEIVCVPRLVRFRGFEVDLRAGELRRDGAKLKLSGQPFQVLTILLEQPGEVVTREELQKRLWPDTFVDVDHNLNTAINKIREVLGDSAESPRFVETLPRRGYRFIATVDGSSHGPANPAAAETTVVSAPTANRTSGKYPSGSKILGYSIAALLMLMGFSVPWILHKSPPHAQRALTRLTFDDGLQFGATWSPDGRYIAYSSDRGGKLDVWVKQVSGGDPIQITKGKGNNWQPDWSPDGTYIAYRSEDGAGGLFVIPALGGAGLERRISFFGYHPRWSPDGSKILFQTHFTWLDANDKFYVAQVDGGEPSRSWHKTWPSMTFGLHRQCGIPMENESRFGLAGRAGILSEVQPSGLYRFRAVRRSSQTSLLQLRSSSEMWPLLV